MTPPIVRTPDELPEQLFGGRDKPAPEPDSAVIGATCRDEPGCALVAAVHKTEPWK